MTHTTTHTTPAADAVSLRFDCEHGSIAYTSSGSPLGERELSMPMKRDSIAKVCVEMLKAIDAATARESALIADRDQLRAAIEVCLSFVHADDRSKPSTDPDLCGEIVRVRLSGLCALAEAVTPGIRLAAHQAFVARTLDALAAPAVEGV